MRYLKQISYTWGLILITLIMTGCSGSSLCECELAEDFSRTLEPYPLLHFTPEMSFYEAYEFNEQGLPLQDGQVKLPLVLRYGLSLYRDYYMQIDSSARQSRVERLEPVVEYLIDEVQCSESGCVWELEGELDILITESPYRSAMSQAQALALFTLSYSIYEDKRDTLLALVDEGLKPFAIDISEGGLSSIQDNQLWYEEYATSARGAVLNGAIFAYAGLEVVREFSDELFQVDITQLQERFIKTLKVKLPEYDAGYTTYYHLLQVEGEDPQGQAFEFSRPVHNRYNQIHTVQMYYLWSVTQDPEFRQSSERFLKYEEYEVDSIARQGISTPELMDEIAYYGSQVAVTSDTMSIYINPKDTIEGLVFYINGLVSHIPNIKWIQGDSLVTLIPQDYQSHQTGNYHSTIVRFDIPTGEQESQAEFRFYFAQDLNQSVREIEVLTQDVDYLKTLVESYLWD